MAGKPQGPAVRRDCCCPKVRHVHGTVQAYNRDNCRCGDCRQAVADDRRHVYRLRTYGRWVGMIDATGARRRLQALACLGWSTPLLDEQCGLSHSVINRVRNGNTRIVTPDTNRAISEVFDKLWNVEAPRAGHNARGYSQVVNHAARLGWVPPLGWDEIDDPDEKPMLNPVEDDCIDEIAVEEALSGRLVALTRAEALECVTRLTDAGYSVAEIAERLHTNARFVQRRRAASRKDDAA